MVPLSVTITFHLSLNNKYTHAYHTPLGSSTLKSGEMIISSSPKFLRKQAILSDDGWAPSPWEQRLCRSVQLTVGTGRRCTGVTRAGSRAGWCQQCLGGALLFQLRVLTALDQALFSCHMIPCAFNNKQPVPKPGLSEAQLSKLGAFGRSGRRMLPQNTGDDT